MQDNPPPVSLNADWFSEKCALSNSAFSIKIKSKLHEEQTPFQTIEIFDTDFFGHLMVIDGCIMLTQKDNFIYHEMMSHPALFSHVGPQDIAIIGGGDCGTLQQVLKHEGVRNVTQVEIDPQVTKLSEQYFPELCKNNTDPRASFLFEDGITWMKQAAFNSLDIIIIDSTDPIGPAQGLFTEEFYRSCRNALRANGILVHQSESPLYHLELINKMRSAMRSAGFSFQSTLTFPLCVYPSGWWSATLSCSLPVRKIKANPALETRYYSAETHQASLATPPFIKNNLL